MSNATKQGTVTKIPTWDLSDRLQKSLRHSELSVQDMATYLGVSRNTVGNYLHGRTTPDKRTLMLWAIRTEVPLPWIETGADTEGGGGGPHTSGYSVGRRMTRSAA